MSRPPITNQRRWKGCLSGQIPAEQLPTLEREHLVRLLHRRGWTDLQIAVHTRMTLYTTVRIRERLGLSANHDERGAA